MRTLRCAYCNTDKATPANYLTGNFAQCLTCWLRKHPDRIEPMRRAVADLTPSNPTSEPHRQNVIAHAVTEAWGCWLPLSVRYGAARAADAVVQAWEADGTSVATAIPRGESEPYWHPWPPGRFQRWLMKRRGTWPAWPDDPEREA